MTSSASDGRPAPPTFQTSPSSDAAQPPTTPRPPLSSRTFRTRGEAAQSSLALVLARRAALVVLGTTGVVGALLLGWSAISGNLRDSSVLTAEAQWIAAIAMLQGTVLIRGNTRRLLIAVQGGMSRGVALRSLALSTGAVTLAALPSGLAVFLAARSSGEWIDASPWWIGAWLVSCVCLQSLGALFALISSRHGTGGTILLAVVLVIAASTLTGDSSPINGSAGRVIASILIFLEPVPGGWIVPTAPSTQGLAWLPVAAVWIFWLLKHWEPRR